MKKIFVLAVLSIFFFGCAKEMTYSRKIQHKWQYVSDDLIFTDGQGNHAVLRNEIEYWEFDDGELVQTHPSGKAIFSYEINGDLLQLKGKNNLTGWDIGYLVKSIDDENMILLFDLTNDLGEKNGEANMNFKRVD